MLCEFAATITATVVVYPQRGPNELQPSIVPWQGHVGGCARQYLVSITCQKQRFVGVTGNERSQTVYMPNRFFPTGSSSKPGSQPFAGGVVLSVVCSSRQWQQINSV